ncbi:hydroxyethylthiazole kinase [Xylanimonas oleitrophica]|uniref:Hydroxyethylthiazole kinase n=1 Tax=Xylanimonas oleitrophica TaxID=2607479 RepID=A0A2W5WW58_9MICO|nr:hydroxyethylthiazole kinase [Xylanimonas oleitrophica]PZR55547.1 hydroxyethylthiazole kinase [Xylanimonas oleitrophica]
MSTAVPGPDGAVTSSSDPGPDPQSWPGLAPQVADVVRSVRQSAPLVHCITNVVVTNFTANVVLAAGAAPAMVATPAESGVMAGAASALLVNLGTVEGDQPDGMRVAVEAATASGVPWVLDPVAIGALPLRTALAAELFERGPAVVRGNASEVQALAGGRGGRGVDSLDTPDDVRETALHLARGSGAVVAVSGTVDLLTDGVRVVRVHAGHPLLTRVTGVGCSLGALVAACAAVTDDRLLAATAATAWMCVAGDLAAAAHPGPGSFAVALVDRLADVAPEAVADLAGLVAERSGAAA